MNASAICIRHGTEQDRQAIRALMRAERVDPTGLDWQDFVVATHEHDIVGAVQMRSHRDGSHELGSPVLSREVQGLGIATRLVDALLATESRPVWTITADASASAYKRWGFWPIDAQSAPVKVRHNYRMGSLARIMSFLKRRPTRKLVILERLPSA